MSNQYMQYTAGDLEAVEEPRQTTAVTLESVILISSAQAFNKK